MSYYLLLTSRTSTTSLTINEVCSNYICTYVHTAYYIDKYKYLEVGKYINLKINNYKL